MEPLIAWFDRPAWLLLGPPALLLLWVLERWRRRPPRLTVADLALFEPDPAVASAARQARRRLDLRWLLRALAALAFTAAAAGARRPPGPAGPLELDLVLDRGLSSAAREPQGGARLARHVAHLEQVLDRLRPDDRVRLHLLPGEGSSPALAPDTARQVLRRTVPAGAPPALEGALPGLLAGVGAGPLLVASDQRVELPPPLGARVAWALAGSATRDRALVALAEDPQGGLCATVAALNAAGPVTVQARVRGSDGRERQLTAEATLPSDGQVLVRWPADALPAEPQAVEAWLEGTDDLALDDRAWAVRADLPRRVGLVGPTGRAVRRALAAIPGCEVRDLAGVPADAADLDLLVVPRLGPEEALPRVAVAVVPTRLPEEPLAGGRLTLAGLEGFPATAAALAATPCTIPGLGPLAPRARATPLLLAGERPFALLSGQGRGLLLTLAAPPESSGWVEQPAFPLFWSELLELAAPRRPGPLVAHPCGEPWDGPRGPERPLTPGLLRDPDGRPLLGLVATLPPRLPAPGAAPFPSQVLDGLEGARPPSRERPLWGAGAALGLLLLLAAWREPSPPRSD